MQLARLPSHRTSTRRAAPRRLLFFSLAAAPTPSRDARADVDKEEQRRTGEGRNARSAWRAAVRALRGLY